VRHKEEKEAHAVEKVVGTVHGLVQGHGREHGVALGAALDTLRDVRASALHLDCPLTPHPLHPRASDHASSSQVDTRVSRLEARVDQRLLAIDEKLEAVLSSLRPPPEYSPEEPASSALGV
jgi:hypothetical protein